MISAGPPMAIHGFRGDPKVHLSVTPEPVFETNLSLSYEDLARRVIYPVDKPPVPEIGEETRTCL